jgi:hypothetical protein
VGDPRLQHRHPRRPNPVKHSEPLFDQSKPIHCKTAAEITPAAVAHLKSFSAASNLVT